MCSLSWPLSFLKGCPVRKSYTVVSHVVQIRNLFVFFGRSLSYASIQVVVFWVVTSCSDVVGYQRFRRPTCLPLVMVVCAQPLSSSIISSTNMPVLQTCEVSPILELRLAIVPFEAASPSPVIHGLSALRETELQGYGVASFSAIT
jgi:hypothetical protein